MNNAVLVCVSRMCTVGILVAMSSCDAGADSSLPTASSSSAPLPTASTPAPAGDELTIAVRDASGASITWRLTCSPPGGNHPDPATACRVLEQHAAAALPAVPKDRRCSQVYGGPETATVTGRWQGQAVRSTLSRINGCEISRWNALVGLLPAGGS